jgi:hypothetical protein
MNVPPTDMNGMVDAIESDYRNDALPPEILGNMIFSYVSTSVCLLHKPSRSCAQRIMVTRRCERMQHTDAKQIDSKTDQSNVRLVCRSWAAIMEQWM